MFFIISPCPVRGFFIGVCFGKRALGRFLCVFCPVAGVGGVFVPVHACTACNGLLLSSSFF
ncbi:hypothetical protein [Moraxella catarrhalis]|uniref:hypothetical protein n=1 Tax=Moraxella catarrhalis TaxID=480 RepID=UPI0011C4CBD9|nr:hypothetical protein [Moraxella catarrhalis]